MIACFLLYCIGYPRNSTPLILSNNHPRKSKADRKMLFYLVFLSKKHEADKEKIDTERYLLVLFNCLPGSFHFLAPVHVVKN